MTLYAHHAARMENQARFDNLVKLGATKGIEVLFVPTMFKYKHPQASTRPYHIKHNGKQSHFGDLGKLETRLRWMIANILNER